VEIALTPRCVLWGFRIKSLLPEVSPECIDILDVEDGPAPTPTAMTSCWPMPKFRPYFRMVDLARFWLPASSLVTDKHSLLGVSSRFHPSSGGSGGSIYHFASVISTTTERFAGTCVAAGVMAGSSCPPYALESHMESVEISVGNEDRGRRHVRTER